MRSGRIRPRQCFIFLGVVLSLLFAQLSVTSISSAVTFERDTSIDVNGSGQYGVAGNSTALRTFNAITIEFWLMPQVACVGNIVAKMYDYAVYCSAGNLSYAFAGTSTSWVGVATTIELPANEWHHVAVSRVASSATTYVYIDGQLHYTGTADGAGTSAIKSSANSYLNIGARQEAATFFNGLIDEVRIFNTTRTEAQVASDMHTWGNLGLSSVVGYYDFNSVSGTSVTNKATNPDANSDLSLVGSPTFPYIESSTVIGDQTVTTFPRSYLNSNGGWYAPDGVSRFRALIVAGGGGGGNDEGGGGGAGGFIDSSTVILSANSPIQIDVGQGGKGANGTAGAYGDEVSRGDNGQDSILGSITAIGGGAGGTSNNTANDPQRFGASGGSGGGGAGESTAGHTAGLGTAGQGFAGGAGMASGAGGGGGGALESGNTDGNSLGGDGATSNITGSTITYAGGGGGGNGNTASTQYGGGAGGGGAGGSTTLASVAGTANTGGGGGGGCGAVACGMDNIQYSGSYGGSGIIILRYTTFGSIAISAINFTSTPTKSTSTTITLTINVAAKVKFSQEKMRLVGCLSRPTSGSAPSYTVTCPWKPAVHGPASLTFLITPTDSSYSTYSYIHRVTVERRANKR